MFLNRRYAGMLLDILLRDEKTSTDFLKQRYNISERTLRNDLNIIDHWLNEDQLPPLIRSRKDGIYLDVPELTKKHIIFKLEEMNPSLYIYTQKERQLYILFKVLISQTPISISELAQMMSVSRNTIISDLGEVEKYLQRWKCILKRKQKVGIFVEGEEYHIRQAYMNIFIENCNIEKWDLLSDSIQRFNHYFNFLALREIRKLAKEIDIQLIFNILKNLEEKLHLTYTDEALNNIIISIIVTLHRIKQNRKVVLQAFHFETLKLSKAYRLVNEEIVPVYNQKLKIDIDPMEMAYMAMHMLVNRVFHYNGERVEVLHNEIKDMDNMVENIVHIVESALNMPLKDKEKLKKGLMLHLEPAIYRMKYDIRIKNPLVDNIKDQYKTYYDAAQRAALYLSHKLNIPIPEEEIAYIAIHVGGAVEGATSPREISVVLICNTGLGTARILESRLKEEFHDIKIVDVLSYATYKNLEKINADLIITTIKVTESDIPVVQVSPLLSDEDMDRLNKYLYKKNILNKESQAHQLHQILKVIQKYCTIYNNEKLKEEIQEIMGIKNRKGLVDHRLSGLLIKEHVQFKGTVNSWEEAVELAAKPLQQTHCITVDYTRKIINNIKKLGPYMVIKKGVAMPHARAEDGVSRLGISFLTLKQGICFGHLKNDPVDMIILLANEDNSSHLPALETLMKMIRHNSSVETLRNFSNYDDFILFIKKFEEELC